jgi:hypothetical protein
MAKLQSKSEKEEKEQYRIVNWSEYNQSLIKRGSLTIWIEEESVSSWYHEGPLQKGAQYYYSDSCIECLLGLKAVFHLAYRQLEGFSNSVLQLMGYQIEVPCYTQICRRAKALDIDLAIPKTRGSLHLVFDSTGLKVYGEGEWKVRKHGYSKRRTWRKLHLGIDEKTGYIHAVVLTENDVDDASQLEPMLDQVKKKVKKAGADGAYDKEKCWDLLEERKIQGIIPPQHNAVYWTDENEMILEDYERNKVLSQIDEIGRSEWKKQSGYHRRSISETAMFRFKTIFGRQLYSRKIDKQKTETAIKIKMLNKMAAIGMPVLVRIN